MGGAGPVRPSEGQGGHMWRAPVIGSVPSVVGGVGLVIGGVWG